MTALNNKGKKFVSTKFGKEGTGKEEESEAELKEYGHQFDESCK